MLNCITSGFLQVFILSPQQNNIIPAVAATLVTQGKLANKVDFRINFQIKTSPAINVNYLSNIWCYLNKMSW